MSLRPLLPFALCALLAANAQALATDPLIEGAKLCTRHLSAVEKEFGIKTHLLSAIASSESGRYHDGLRITLPWPWTINAAGEGHYYASKQEAINAVRKFQLQGIKSIDVGCMQVNLQHHANAFRNLAEAFEPEYNISYAASFLKSLYDEMGSWKKASAAYHSRTPARGAQYLSTVYGKWRTIISRLQAAGMNSPALAASEQEANSVKGQTPSALEQKVSAPYGAKNKPAAPAAMAQQRLPEQQGQKVAERKSPSLRVIKVSEVPKRERQSGVFVIRSQPEAAQPVKLADASAVTQPIILAPAASDAKIAHVSAPPRVSSRKTGPNFIFQD